jgi:hypothetical protein
VVYITEAHASNMWQMQSNVKDGVIFKAPTTEAERESLAESCVVKLHITIPALVDSLTNAVEQTWTGWPDRIYLIGKEGIIRYKSEPGPFGFKPDLLANHLKSELNDYRLESR